MTKNTNVIFFIIIVILGKITGFGKDLLLSYHHGAAELTDAFFIANSLASLFYASLYLSVPAITIPYYTRVIDKLNDTHYQTELYSVCQSFVVLSVILSVSVFIYAESLVQLSFSEISYDTEKTAIRFLKIISLTFCFSTIVALFNALQVVNGSKFLSFIVPVVNNLTFIVSLLIFTRASEFINILWAGLFGWLFLCVVNAYYSSGLISFKFIASFPLFTKKSLLVVFLPALIAFYIEQINGYISIFFASGLGEGAVSVISYANKINLIVVSVFMVFLNVYIFPKLASSRFEKQGEGVEVFSSVIFKWILILSVPLAFILYIYAKPIISLLFERGEFNKSDALSVASVLSILSLSLPLLLIRDLLNRIVFSFENTAITMLSLMISVAIHGVFSFYLSREYGLNGVAIAFVLSAFVNVVLLFIFLRIHFDIRLLSRNLKDVIICFLSLFLSAVLSFIFFGWVDIGWVLESIFLCISYLMFLYFLGSEEIRIILLKLSL